MQDQQGLQSEEVLQVVVCECTGENVCRGLLPFSSRLGPAAIGLLFAGLLLLAFLLLFCFLCDCQSKTFQHIPLNLQDEGNQTLVKYNEEGGGSIYKPESMLASNAGLTDGMKVASAPLDYIATDGYRNGTLRSPAGYQYSSLAFQEMSNGGGVMSMPYHNYSMARREREGFKNGGGQLSQTFSLARTERNLAERIERKS